MHAPPPLTLTFPDTQWDESIIVRSSYWHYCQITNAGKMDDDDEDHDGLPFGSSQESKLDPPLVLESVWDCPGITLDTTEDEDGKTIPGWCFGYCLIPSNCGDPRFFKHCNASNALSHLTKGKDHLHWLAKTFLQTLSMP